MTPIAEVSPETEDAIRFSVGNDCAAEDSTVFQIVNCFIDLLERGSPRHSSSNFSLPSRYQQRMNTGKSRSGRQSPPLVRVKFRLPMNTRIRIAWLPGGVIPTSKAAPPRWTKAFG